LVNPLTYNINISNIGDVAHSGPGFSYTVTDSSCLPEQFTAQAIQQEHMMPLTHSVTWNVTDDLTSCWFSKAFTVVLDNA
jgi:hypothetical protein